MTYEASLLSLHPLQHALRVILHGIEAFLLPDICIFCGRVLIPQREEDKSLLQEGLHTCRKCMALLPLCTPDEIFSTCLSNEQTSDPIPDFSVAVPFRYEAPISEAIRMMKFHNADYAAKTIATFLSAAVALWPCRFDAVIPIPLSEKRLQRRGYNQAFLLAEPIASSFGIPCMPGFLRRAVHTKQQSRFTDPIMRRANISGAFCVPENVDVAGLSILLVDDVMTTGATLHEAAATLYRNGAAFVLGAAAASGRFSKNNDFHYIRS